MSTQAPKGPPYSPQTWSLGGIPDTTLDIPVTAVFLALFLGGAIYHMTIFQINLKRKHRFLFSAVTFGFCMTRTVTCILRICSASLPHNISIAIASQIFTAAGVVLLFIVNLVFAQRLIRSTHPRVGWHTLLSITFKFLYALIIVTIIMVITIVVQSYYTLSTYTHMIDRAIMLYGVTTFAVISFLPILLTLATILIPRQNNRPLDKFGEGRWRYKVTILFIGTALICFGASYRAGTSWLTPVRQTEPLPGVLGKGPFYVVNFTVEIFTVYLYAISRVDKRFYTPDGAKAHKNYQKAAAAGQNITNLPNEELQPVSEPRTSMTRTVGSSEAGLWTNVKSETDVSRMDVEKQASEPATP